MPGIEDKIVFALSPPDARGTATLIVGLPKGAWEYIKDGKTNHLDLTRVGVPIQLILFGGETHDSIKAELDRYLASRGVAALDARREDFSIKPPADKGR